MIALNVAHMQAAETASLEEQLQGWGEVMLMADKILRWEELVSHLPLWVWFLWCFSVSELLNYNRFMLVTNNGSGFIYGSA